MRDEEFARQLDATLLSNGAQTFLAERDIQVGDSIPERIYGNIEIATSLIYIISTHSIQSRWVGEELSIAKMREKQSLGFRIFPVLIDEVELPVSVFHLKYADFRAWRVSQSYRQACLELLQAMNIAPRLVSREHLQWYAANAENLRDIDRTISDAAGQLDGALDASQGAAPHQHVHYCPTKYVFEEGPGIVKTLETLTGLIDESIKSDRLQALRDKSQEALSRCEAIVGYPGGPKRGYEDYELVDHLLWSLKETRNMLRELRMELEIILLSTVPVNFMLDVRPD